MKDCAKSKARETPSPAAPSAPLHCLLGRDYAREAQATDGSLRPDCGFVIDEPKQMLSEKWNFW
jgi:hypothetical protein